MKFVLLNIFCVTYFLLFIISVFPLTQDHEPPTSLPYTLCAHLLALRACSVSLHQTSDFIAASALGLPRSKIMVIIIPTVYTTQIVCLFFKAIPKFIFVDLVIMVTEKLTLISRLVLCIYNAVITFYCNSWCVGVC